MYKKLTTLCLLIGLVGVVGLTGCKKDDGPMEDAGEKLDDAVDEAKDAAEDLTD